MDMIALFIALMIVCLAVAVICPIFTDFIDLFCDEDEDNEDEEDL